MRYRTCKCVCVCIYERACMCLPEQCKYNPETGRSAIHTTLHNGLKDTGSQTLNSPPNKPEAEQWGNEGICHHTEESARGLENEDRQDTSAKMFLWRWRMRSSNSHFCRQGSGTDSGCGGRDSLGLQQRIPATSPKGICHGLWQWPPPYPVTSLESQLVSRDPAGHNS